MLARLLIKNYALIDTLDISFSNGLNIITGETGAGKSIIMGALGLILGNRVEGKPFFSDQKKCIIEGVFDIQKYDLSLFFSENDLDYDHETIIRREISIDGKSRAFVNDTPVTLQVLKALGERLIDIHSQHATLQINSEEFQFMVLDTLAQNRSLLVDYRKELVDYKAAVESLETAKNESAKSASELEYNRFVFDELEKMNLKVGEQMDLENEQAQLENAEEIKRALNTSIYALQDADTNVISQLKEAVNQVNLITNFLPGVNEFSDRLQSVVIEVKDLVEEFVSLEEKVVLDESRLHLVSERLSDLYALQKKHRADTEQGLIKLRDELESKILAVDNQEDWLKELELKVTQHFQSLTNIASKLSNNRREIVSEVENSVAAILARVGMPQAKLSIDITTQDKFNSLGFDKIQFLFSANRGQGLNPIHRVASGGELSRVMLAIKSIVVKKSSLPTIIFDEIDTGVSGEVALQVGELMEDLSNDMQVMAITHLPQIASKGDSHFKVFKEENNGVTKTNIVLLDNEDRVVEIAQMLSGANPGDTAIEHAKKLLNN